MKAMQGAEQLADAKWLAERVAFEEQPENAIVVENPPRQWHKKLAVIRQQFRERFREYKVLEDRYLNRKITSIPGSWPGPDMDALDYDLAERKGWIVSFGGLRVSPATYDRALAIANALVIASGRRNCELTFDIDQDRIILKMAETTLSLAIRERQKRETVDRPQMFAALGLEKRPIPTNRLVIVIEKLGRSASEIIDNSQLIEMKLNSVFLHMYRSGVDDRERARVNEVRETIRARDLAAFEELSRQNAVIAAEKAQQEQEEKGLISEAANWHEAQQIRGFVAQVANHSTVTNRAAVDAWAQWALTVADKTDSLLERISALNKSE